MILIAYDGSKHGRDAVASASRLLHGPAIVLHVLTHAPRAPLALDPTMGAALDEEAWAERRSRLRRQAQDVAGEGVRLAQEAGIAAEPLVVEDESHRVWRTILDIAQEREVDAIVLGHEPCSALHSVLPGSVTRNVVAHSTRPVLVMPCTGERPFENVAQATLRPHHDEAERLAHQAAARHAAANPRRGVPGG